MILEDRWEVVLRGCRAAAAGDKKLAEKLEADPELLRVFYYIGAAVLVQILIDTEVEPLIPPEKLKAVKTEILRRTMEMMSERGMKVELV